ncbi:MAG TPA: response regulator [Verrucomicrobiae bacterium]|jgi:CheY-like chemotaxis protein
MLGTKSILLVDDSANDLLLLREAFEKIGFAPALAEVYNGEEAIAYLSGKGSFADRRAHPFPSLVLLDLNMPRKNGFEVLAWVRAQTVIKRVPIIILSASLREEDVEQAFALGVNAFLVKPTGFSDLVRMAVILRDWLGINQFPTFGKV